MNEKINPKHTALLVMDYQNGIVDMIENVEPILSKMASTIAAARKSGMTIGYVRVAFADEDYTKIPTTNKGFSARANGSGMHADAPETQVHDAVAPEDGDIIVRKVRVGAFSTTDLDKQLKERDIDTIVLAGFSTSGVVLSTVRDAADKDYRIFVLEDVTADTDKSVHDMLVQKVFPRQAHVITSDDLLSLVEAE